MLRASLSHRQAGGEMASDGQPPAHAGHQHLLPAVPLAGAQVHEEQRALPAPQDTYCLQLQHGLPQLLHLQRGTLLIKFHLKPGLYNTWPKVLDCVYCSPCVLLLLCRHSHYVILSFIISGSMEMFFCYFQLFMAARSASYSYICQRVDYSDDPNEVRVSVAGSCRHTHKRHMRSLSCINRNGAFITMACRVM